jgi:ribosomal protein S17E
VIALISEKSQKFRGLNNIFKFSPVTLMIFNKITENSRIETYFQVFTGDFNDVNKIIENSAIETYFQVFTGDFNV